MSAMRAVTAWAAFGLLAWPVLGGRFRQRGQLNEERTKTMASLYPFYHSTDAIRTKLQQLAERCEGMQFHTEEGDGGPSRAIDVVTIKAPGTNPVNKNFLLFGEHSRELISPESGLRFVQALCGEGGDALAAQARDVLADSEFQIVVNGNPASRRLVEEGDFCLRTDPNGVDLNRNWDEKWQPGATMDPDETNPGPRAFSEPETKIFKSLVEAYQPTTFLTVHSGTRGMYMPWAYDTEHLADRNQPEMMAILKALDAGHCKCPFGAAGREVGYSCPGTCLDWVYDELKAPYAFAFEIYVNPEEDSSLLERWQKKIETPGASFLQLNSTLAHSHFQDLFEEHPSSFVQVRSQKRGKIIGMTTEECFAQFNPPDETTFRNVVDNWAGAYLDMANMVAANLKGANSNTKIF